MCIRINKVILFILSLFLVSLLQAKDMSIYKSACKEKGIAEGTEKFGACVMDLYKNKDKLPVASKKNDKMAPYKSTCSEIGFKEGTEKFGQCVLKLYARDKGKKKQMISEKNRRIQEERLQQEQASREARDRQLRELEIQERRARMELMEKQKKALEQQQKDREWDAAQDLIDRGLKRGKYAEPKPAAAPNVNVTIPDKRVHCQWIGYGASRQYYCR